MLSGRSLDKPEPPSSSKDRIGPNANVRPHELEDWLNRNLYHPLSHRLAEGLDGTFVTPNMVSVAGGFVVALAAWVYALNGSVWLAVGGLLLHMSWHVLDGADGDLARMSGRVSQNGEIVDGLSDYAGHLVLYIVLGTILVAEYGPPGGWIMAATALARIFQTVFYETQRRQYQFWVHGREWLRLTSADLGAGRAGFRGVAAFYLWLSGMMETGGRRLDAVVMQTNDSGRAQIAASVAQRWSAVLRPLSLLSSNYRTIGIGVAMILGTPLTYALVELLALTALMIALMFRSRRMIADTIDQFSASTAR